MHGFKAWAGRCGGKVQPCATLDEAVPVLLGARERGEQCRVVACRTLTQDRELTPDEASRLIALATEAVI